ncbi:adenylate cyclase, partial [Streptomyces inhibens]
RSRALYADGAAATPAGLRAGAPADARILDRSGRPHPRRFALGPHTDARSGGAFARPRTNAPAFRQNDATARALLTFLRERAVVPAPVSAASVPRTAPTPEDSRVADQ